MKLLLIIGCCLVFIIGCGERVEPKVVKEDLNKIMDCKDTRDGELFSFNTNSIKDISAPLFGEVSYTVTTFEGKKKRLSGKMEAYIKCDERF